MKKLCILFGLAFSTILCSGGLTSSSVKAQSNSCDFFTGTYRDLGKGVIVHLGGGRLVVYNGNPTPLEGRCLGNGQIEVRFRSNLTLTGEKERNSSDVIWSNRRLWRREGNTVSFPLAGF